LTILEVVPETKHKNYWD